MNTKLSILFFVKRTKTNTDGLLPIFIRVTINGERIEFSTKRFTSSDKWSVEGNRMKGTSAESKATNSFLDTLKAKIYDYQQQLIREDEIVNAENMRNKINGIEKRSHMLVGIFKQHNEEMKTYKHLPKECLFDYRVFILKIKIVSVDFTIKLLAVNIDYCQFIVYLRKVPLLGIYRKKSL